MGFFVARCHISPCTASQKQWNVPLKRNLISHPYKFTSQKLMSMFKTSLDLLKLSTKVLRTKKRQVVYIFNPSWTHRVFYSSRNSAEQHSSKLLEDYMWCNAACITLYLPQLMTVRPVSPASTSQLLWGNVVCQAQYGVSALNNGGLVLPGWHHCHSFFLSFFFWREGFETCCFCYCYFSYVS